MGIVTDVWGTSVVLAYTDSLPLMGIVTAADGVSCDEAWASDSLPLMGIVTGYICVATAWRRARTCLDAAASGTRIAPDPWGGLGFHAKRMCIDSHESPVFAVPLVHTLSHLPSRVLLTESAHFNVVAILANQLQHSILGSNNPRNFCNELYNLGLWQVAHEYGCLFMNKKLLEQFLVNARSLGRNVVGNKYEHKSPPPGEWLERTHPERFSLEGEALPVDRLPECERATSVVKT